MLHFRCVDATLGSNSSLLLQEASTFAQAQEGRFRSCWTNNTRLDHDSWGGWGASGMGGAHGIK